MTYNVDSYQNCLHVHVVITRAFPLDALIVPKHYEI